jgi:23S rRNA pseudouridine955/2504/2580 synthase
VQRLCAYRTANLQAAMRKPIALQSLQHLVGQRCQEGRASFATAVRYFSAAAPRVSLAPPATPVAREPNGVGSSAAATAENEQRVKWLVANEESGTRLDRFIKRRATGVPPGLIQRLIRQRRISVGGVTAIRNAHPVYGGEVVEFPGDIKLGLSRGKKKPKEDDVSLQEAEYIRSRIIHRDARCLVLDKPAGLATQGGSNVGSRHVEALLPGLGSGRYWLVHRLDKEVSGALVVARDVGAAASLAGHFRARRVEKTYWALVEGNVRSRGGLIQMDINGKSAETEYRVVQDLGGFGAWVALRPRTGRKHQLRIHCAEGLKCAIVGETKYGPGVAHMCGGRNMPFRAAPSNGIADIATDHGLHLHARTLVFPKLTRVDSSSRHRSKSGQTKARPPPPIEMVCVLAPLSDHMKETWAQFGLVARHGDDIAWDKTIS